MASAGALPCAADVLATNFGPGYAYIVNDIQAIDTIPVLSSGSELAVEFSPSETATLTSVTDAVGTWGGTTDQYFFTINADFNGAPGATLDSLQTGLIPADGNTHVETENSTLAPTLYAGENYWLVMTGANTGGYFPAWAVNGQGISGFDGLQGGTWTVINDVTPVFEINGVAATPEPATVGMLLCAGGAALLFRRRNRC